MDIFEIVSVITVFLVPVYWVTYMVSFARKWQEEIGSMHQEQRLASIPQIEKIDSITQTETKTSKYIFIFSIITLFACVTCITLFGFYSIPHLVIKFLLFLNVLTLLHHMGTITHISYVKKQIR